MDARQLKDHLYRIARQNGPHTLTRDELDFLEGRITFATYQNRCYQQYCRDNLSDRPGRTSK